jgi:hypothetical protein
VIHFDDDHIWHVLVKSDGHAVKLDVYFGFILLWQPDVKDCSRKSLRVSCANYSPYLMSFFSILRVCFSRYFTRGCCRVMSDHQITWISLSIE